MRSIEEFYPYLAQGDFEKRVETTLKQDHPKAYQIFNRIRDKVKIQP